MFCSGDSYGSRRSMAYRLPLDILVSPGKSYVGWRGDDGCHNLFVTLGEPIAPAVLIYGCSMTGFDGKAKYKGGSRLKIVNTVFIFSV